MYRVALALAAQLAALFISLVTITPAQALEAYLFRGAGDFSFIGKGLTFSNGMDRLGEKLTAAGVPAIVYRWEAVDWAYRDIMKRRPDAVMIMGHSMGALSTITLANRLKGSGIRVAYIGTIDIPGPAAMTPANVEVAENYYHAFPVFGQLAKPRGHAGTVHNELVWGQIHITMEKSKVVHNAALNFVSRNRAAEQTMQAYSQDAPQSTDVMAQVDAALTTGTVSQPGEPLPPESIPAADIAEAATSHQPVDMTSLLLAQNIPVPTRAPRDAYQANGLAMPLQ